MQVEGTKSNLVLNLCRSEGADTYLSGALGRDYLDDDSFREVGSVAGFASYDEDGGITAFTPANMVGGWGQIEGRTAIVCADDFTSRGGHAD